MRYLTWGGTFLAGFVALLDYTNLAEGVLFTLLAVAVVLIGIGSATGK